MQAGTAGLTTCAALTAMSNHSPVPSHHYSFTSRVDDVDIARIIKEALPATSLIYVEAGTQTTLLIRKEICEKASSNGGEIKFPPGYYRNDYLCSRNGEHLKVDGWYRITRCNYSNPTLKDVHAIIEFVEAAKALYERRTRIKVLSW